MSSWKKYGSPYDPNHTGKGKIERPQLRQQVLRCDDPNCPDCYPGESSMGGRNIEFEQLEQILFGRARFGGFTEQDILQMAGGAARPAAASPDLAYNAARAKVTRWIVPAPEQSFSDIIGNDEALGMLKDAIEAPVKHKALYEAYDMKMPKGAMLYGPPGCGKTMFARAAASEMHRLYGKGNEFLSLSGSELQMKYIGETEERIKEIFNFARLYKAKHGYPLLVFIDEADVILPDRTGRVRRVMGWEESQVACFLAEMDGMQESGAFVLLATNRPDVIDQAVLRDGRCDFKVVIKRPNPEAVEAIVRKGFIGKLMKDKIDDLVFAAVEGLNDPHKVIIDYHALKFNLEEKTIEDRAQKHFCMEHIVSGAMAASIASRSLRYAFARDKSSGKPSGIVQGDVLQAVNDLFEENKGLDHSFALEEFKAEFQLELNAMDKEHKNKLH